MSRSLLDRFPMASSRSRWRATSDPELARELERMRLAVLALAPGADT